MSDRPVDPSPPAPAADVDSAPHWDNLRRHRLALQVCLGCGRRRFPPTPRCPFCADPRSRWDEPVRTGTVYSAVTVHRTLDAAFGEENPYTVVTVDLDGGGRMLGRAAGGRLDIGDRVAATYVDTTAGPSCASAPAGPPPVTGLRRGDDPPPAPSCAAASGAAAAGRTRVEHGRSARATYGMTFDTGR